MISPAAAELLRRGREQIRSGIAHVQSGEPLIAEVWFRAATASLEALHALLDEPSHKPLRRMALVVMPRDEEAEPDWFARKANDNGGDGAA
jgi:hypothetical protein